MSIESALCDFLLVINSNFGGLEWVDGNKLYDLDYADDIAIIETSQMGMQMMTEEVAKRTL